MRLIDADKLYENLANNLCFIMGDGTDGKAIDTYSVIGDAIHDTFEAQPIAYDVDAVVSELSKASGVAQPVGWSRKKEVVELKTAIEIVKGGGVDV